MKNVEIQARAFQLFLAGKSHSQIAEEIGIPHRTLKNWSKKEKWVEKRDEVLQSARQNIAERFKEKLVKGAEAYLDFALDIGLFCKEKLNEAKLKSNPDIADLVYMAARGARIYRAVMPEAPEQVSNQILEELRKINEQLKLA